MNQHEQQKTNRNTLARARAILLGDFRACFATESGQRALAHLRRSAGWGVPSFLPPAGGGPFDPYAAAFRDGRKSIIDEIHAHLDSPEDAESKPGPGAVK